MQELFKFAGETIFITELALPQSKTAPARRQQLGFVLAVARSISLNLCGPVFHTGLWDSRSTLASVSMPKAAMDENGQFPAYPSHVGLPWNVLAVKAIARVA